MKLRLSYILISVVMLGILLTPFSPLIQSKTKTLSLNFKQNTSFAQTATSSWYYEYQSNTGVNQISAGYQTLDACNSAMQTSQQNGVTIIRTCFESSTQPNPSTTEEQQNNGTEQTLSGMLRTCGISRGSFIIGCFVQIMYFLFVTIPSWLMGLTAQVFDFLAGLTLSDGIYREGFINTIWKIVRDFANIFFIVILLYAAFQIILGLGHGGGKKVVASVILMALLVNFSLFISRVIVDSGNVLGLIFYNKIVTDHVKYEPVINPSKGVPDKDIAGALVSSFNVNNFFTGKFFEGLENDPKNWETAGCWGGCVGRTITNFLAISLIVTYGLVAYSLAWIFLVVGLSFLGRMIMLIMLMVVSPLAFVSASIPKFRGIDTIGFDSWIKKLFENSFVVAIFMAILYLISEILKANIFESYAVNQSGMGVVQRIMLIFIPALLILIFLHKGKSYAVKASGEITQGVFGAAKVLGGLALGGAALGAAGVAAAGRGTVGSVTRYIQDNSKRKQDSFGNLKQNWKGWSLGKKINPLSYLKQGGKTLASSIASIPHTIKMPTKTAGVYTSIGEMMQKKEREYDKSNSATNTLNSTTASVFGGKYGYPKDVKFDELRDDGERQKVKEQADKDFISKQVAGNTYENVKDGEQKAAIDRAYEEIQDPMKRYDDLHYDDVAKELKFKVDVVVRNPNYNKADPLSQEFIKQAKTVKGLGGWEQEDLYDKKSMRGELISGMRKGSYDVRDISKAPSAIKNPLGLFGAGAMVFGAPVLGAGVLTGLAGGLRGVLKKGLGQFAKGSEEYGKVQKDFLKDLGGVLTGALKNSKVDVNLKDVVKEVGGDHSSGGHH